MLWPLWLSADSEVSSAAELALSDAPEEEAVDSAVESCPELPGLPAENMIQISSSASTTMDPNGPVS
ncbi:hypothetical protein CLOSTASPAR_04242 [[Clostridium] asparagiforme DSM 15981]|uniref:Uncharacterized protein n=1 Tax=[Clostridium] asparagiforme DSM 15981 TaxID=518636 RepID=C0D4P5_9FIRM|nr:hypothetical protein CLOSTASPAR_04242 [[Clostridium] asparagiforme DSM 15981]